MVCGSRVAIADAEHRRGHDVLRDRAEKFLRRLVFFAWPLVPRLRWGLQELSVAAMPTRDCSRESRYPERDETFTCRGLED